MTEAAETESSSSPAHPLREAGHPSVAVIIPCWNAEKYVARAIQSVLDQDYPNLEVIVIDDGSTDNSLDVIRSFADRIRWETGPNRGAPAARNRGLALTEAEYVMFLDADDYISGPFLNGMSEAALDRPDLVFGPQYILDSTGLLSPRLPEFNPTDRQHALELWVANTLAQTQSVLWKASFIRAIGGWDQNLVRNQDVEIGLRALLKAETIAVNRRGMSVWVQHPSETRISANYGSQAALGIFNYLEKHLPALLARLSNSGLNSLGLRYYETARWLFRVGENEVARRALARSKELGARPASGFRERVLVGLLGLEARERVGRTKRMMLTHLRRNLLPRLTNTL